MTARREGRAAREGRADRTLPSSAPPMLAVLTDERFSDAGWVYEPKLGGIRCLAYVGRSGIRLLSHNRKPLNAAYPEIIERLDAATEGDVVLDGEIVALVRGVSSFQRLQQRSGLSDPRDVKRSRVRVHYFVFDILFSDGRDLRKLPLTERQRLLGAALLVGYHADGALQYAGKVGTGYDARTLASLGARLGGLERRTSPFGGAPRIAGRVHWVRPVLVAQVGFQEWTAGGLLRQPRFLGLREDKDPADVVRERPEG